MIKLPRASSAIGALLLCAGLAVAQPVRQEIGPSVHRWFPSADAAAARVPSHALEQQPGVKPGPAPEAPLQPDYVVGEGRTTARFKLESGTSVYGAGRTPGPLLRNGQTFDDGPVETPWLLVVRADGSAFGIFADTTYATGISLEGEIKFTSDDKSLPLVVIEGESPRNVVTALNELTGRMEMPPLWALGYQQFSAYTEPQLRHAAKFIKENDLPVTTLWLGVDPLAWPLSYRSEVVPDINKLAADMKAAGFRLVSLIGKTVPASLDSRLLGPVRNNGYYLKQDDGSAFEQEVSPDEHHLVLDFSRAETRNWWAGQITDFMKPGISGFISARWFPEPFPASVRMQADADLGGPDSSQRYFKSLDTQFARATWKGAGGESVNKRPFAMIDARAIGSQRYTGALIDWPEKSPDWPRMFVAAALNTSMSGQPFVGTLIKPPFQDAGSDPNLLWIGTAATFPMVAGTFFLPEDLSQFPTEAADTLRAALHRRARLTPYIYTQCFRAFFACQPILQPIFYADLKDAALRDNDYGFLIGDDLLIMPRTEPGKPADVPLKGAWRRIDFGDASNRYLPDIYLKPGSLIATAPVMRTPDEKPLDPVTLIANPDDSGSALGFLYEDAGDGYEFYNNQARGIGYRITRDGDAYLVRLSQLDYGLPLPTRKLEVRIITPTGELTGSGSEKGTIKIPIPQASEPKR